MAGPDIGNIVSSTTSSFGEAGKIILIVVLALIILTVVCSLIYWYFSSKKKWNLQVEFKLPRSDGRITQAEWGKGCFDSKKGVVFLKRNKMRKVPMQVFDIKEYLQGTSTLTVIQLGPEDFRPVLNDSWSSVVVEYKDDKTGEVKQVKEAIMNIRMDTGVNKAWKSSWDSAAKKAYSLASFFQQFQTPIAIGIVIVCVFVGFAVIWNRLPTICH
jgi:hypothetical protein